MIAAAAVAIVGASIALAVRLRGGGGGAPVPASVAHADGITFNRHIAPILFKNCATCHRPGEAAPFSLLTYADARKRADQIADVTERRLMPPWLPEAGYGEFAHERRLSPVQISLIARWVREGANEGDSADLPPAPTFAVGWTLGKPDVIVSMPEAYTLPAEGTDVYRNFVLPIPAGALAGGRYVRAAELRPGDPRIVHHVFMLVDRGRTSRELDAAAEGVGYPGLDAGEGAQPPSGHFLSWQPGKVPLPGEDAHAFPLADGSDLVLQMHMRPSGKPERVQGSVGLYFAKRPPTRPTEKLQLASLTIDVPPGEANYVAEDRYVLPVDVELLGVLPHAHSLCRKMEAWATLPGGSRQWLIKINDWNFDWQGEYAFARPPYLPRGATLEMRYTYDNSAENPRNPNRPPKRVTYGPQSSDEMGSLSLQVIPRDARDAAVLQGDFARKRLVAIVDRVERLLRDDPGNYEHRVALGKSLLALGRPADAIPHFRTAIAARPDDAEVIDYLGRAQLALRDLPAARATLESALAANPNYHRARNNLGLVELEAGDFARAAEHFRLAVAAAPGDAIARNNLGTALLSQGKRDEAIEQFEAVLRANPEDPYARSMLSKARFGK